LELEGVMLLFSKRGWYRLDQRLIPGITPV
jgi:hypothetical protein